MHLPRFVALFGCAALGISAAAGGEPKKFAGWEAIRVIEQDGYPEMIHAVDIDQDGSEELLVANARYSRIDIYSYAQGNQNDAAEIDGNADSPNTLPMAADIRHTEIQLEQLPLAAIAVPAGEKLQLAILVSQPNRVLFYGREEGKWKQDRRVDLLDGELGAVLQHMLMHQEGDTAEILIPFDKGIQKVALQEEAKAAWLEPREKRSIADWWLLDADGDGMQDIVEQRRDADQSLCWLRGDGNGNFSPAQVLHDRSVADARVLAGFDKAPIFVLDDSSEGLVRRYSFAKGDEGPMGRLLPLPLSDAREIAWCGMLQDSSPTLVAASPDSPQLRTFTLNARGWQPGGSFPSIGGVDAIVCPQAAPSVLLMWIEESGELYRSEWSDGRLSYPSVWTESTDSSNDTKVVAIGTVGDITWWARIADSDIELFRWGALDEQPKKTVFRSAAASAEDVLWIGGDRLLVKDRRARGTRVVQAAADQKAKATSSQPVSLQKADIKEFRLLSVDGKLHATRFTNGVMQWLDDDLKPVDQVMLANGRELIDFIPESLTSGWALEKGAPYLHRIEPDGAGVAAVANRVKVRESIGLVHDAHVGMMLLGRDSLIHASSGQSDGLEQKEALDRRLTRSSGGRKSTCHRFLIADIDLDGKEDLILCDDVKHNLTAVSIETESMQSFISWPIFEDLTYPYSDYDDALVQEPRAICAMDIDGDGHPDCALLCHDRLLIYLGRESK